MDAGVIVPVVMFVTIFSVPLMAIWTKHKREMAMLGAEEKGGISEKEAEKLRSEVKDLRDKVNALTLEMDGVNALLRGMHKSEVKETEQLKNLL
jgi:hypothetical protein